MSIRFKERIISSLIERIERYSNYADELLKTYMLEEDVDQEMLERYDNICCLITGLEEAKNIIESSKYE